MGIILASALKIEGIATCAIPSRCSQAKERQIAAGFRVSSMGMPFATQAEQQRRLQQHTGIWNNFQHGLGSAHSSLHMILRSWLRPNSNIRVGKGE